MKNKKQLISAIVALSVLSLGTCASAFAINQAEKNDAIVEDSVIVSEETTEETTEAATEEATEATTEAVTEEATDEPEVEDTTEAPEADEETDDTVTEDEEETETEEETEKPAKPIKLAGRREFIEIINKVFDFENKDFADSELKDEWFDFCEENLKEPEAPVKPEPPADGEKPEPPAKPDGDFREQIPENM